MAGVALVALGRAEQGRRAQLANAAKAALRESGRRKRVPLATSAQILEALERAAALAEQAAGDKLARARALASIAAQAADLLKADLDRQGKELNRILDERPDLARMVRQRLALVPPGDGAA